MSLDIKEEDQSEDLDAKVPLILLGDVENIVSLIEEREASPDVSAVQPGGLTKLSKTVSTENTPDAEVAHYRRRNGATKRKHSPPLAGSTPGAGSPAPPAVQVYNDPSYVTSLPVLLPHGANLPPSNSSSATFEFHTLRSHPINKHNFRYTACGPSPSSMSILPAPYQRMIEQTPQTTRFSWEDRSNFTYLTEDACTITAEKGWRAARANIGVREGNWYWEVKVQRGGGEGGREKGGVGEGSWVRLGIGRRETTLNAPVGIDGYSYAYRDRTGDKVTLARSQPYGEPYGSSSTIGIYISLPPRPQALPHDKDDPTHIIRKRIPIRYKGQLYFESAEYTPSKEMEDLGIDPAHLKSKQKPGEEEPKKAAPGTKDKSLLNELENPPRPLPKLENSKIAFFLDGKPQGIAFKDLYDFLPLEAHLKQDQKKGSSDGLAAKMMENWHDDGTLGYYPMVSVFGGAIATLNSGPDFAFPPPQNIEAVLRETPSPSTESSSPHDTAVEDLQPSTPNWRPLCERYAEFLAEQARLDDLDEQEAIRLHLEKKAVEESAAIMQAEADARARDVASAKALQALEKKAQQAAAKRLKTMDSDQLQATSIIAVEPHVTHVSLDLGVLSATKSKLMFQSDSMSTGRSSGLIASGEQLAFKNEADGSCLPKENRAGDNLGHESYTSSAPIPSPNKMDDDASNIQIHNPFPTTPYTPEQNPKSAIERAEVEVKMEVDHM